jgi:DHA2 family multidrug resistance protein-like MFS transporter
MDLTVLHMAVPQLSTDLEPTSAQLLWIIDIYGFLVAGSLITMGTLGDRIGRRRLLLIGPRLSGRVHRRCASTRRDADRLTRAARHRCRDAGTADAILRNMFLDPKQRTFAIGVWTTSFAVGAAIGPLLGGALLEFFWWGSVFLLAVPVMVLLLVLAPVLLPEYRDPNAGRIDLASAALSLAAVLALIFGLKHAAQHGFSWFSALPILIGAALGGAFIQRQRRLRDPLIDLSLFRAPAFSASLAIYMLGTFVAFGIFIFMTQYLLLVLGMSPLEAGIWTVPFALGFVFGAMLAPRLVRRLRPADVMAGGLALAAVGFVVLTQTSRSDGPGILVAGMVISRSASRRYSPWQTISSSAPRPRSAPGPRRASRKPPPSSAARSASRCSAAWPPRCSAPRCRVKRCRTRSS